MPTEHEQTLCRCERRWGALANTHWNDGRRVCDACSRPIEASCAYADPHCPCSDGESACHYEWAGDSPPWVAPKGLTPRRELLAPIARLERRVAVLRKALREIANFPSHPQNSDLSFSGAVDRMEAIARAALAETEGE